MVFRLNSLWRQKKKRLKTFFKSPKHLMFRTLEKEATGLFYSSSRHSKPNNGVSPHGLGPQFALHLLMK